MNINEILQNAKHLNTKIEQLNSKSAEARGFVNSEIGRIRTIVNRLKEQGYHLNFSEENGIISDEFLKEFKELYLKVVGEITDSITATTMLVEAIENRDYDKIQEITGKDVRKVNYRLSLGSLEELQEAEKRVNTSAITGIVNNAELNILEDKQADASQFQAISDEISYESDSVDYEDADDLYVEDDSAVSVEDVKPVEQKTVSDINFSFSFDDLDEVEEETVVENDEDSSEFDFKKSLSNYFGGN